MKRLFWYVCFIALVGIILLVLLSAVAQAWTVTGGTPEQRAEIDHMLVDSQLNMAWLDSRYAGGLKVRIEPTWEGYWDFDDEGLVSFDIWPGAAGLFYSYGLIVIKSSYSPGPNSFFGEVFGHEATHADYFRLPTQARQEWQQMVGPGDPSNWYQSPIEHYAETLRLVFWDRDIYFKYDYSRTQLKSLLTSAVSDWRRKFPPFSTTNTTVAPTTTTLATTTTVLPPSTTTSTTVLPPSTTSTIPQTTTTTIPALSAAFRDIDPEDRELNAALHWAKNNGYVRGYVDGTFRPYKSLAKRHVVLIMGPAGYAFYPDWAFDYSIATRGEVKELIGGWLEDRGEEPLLRSQLVRVLWRQQ